MMYNCIVQDMTGQQFRAWVHRTYKIVEVLHTVNGCCPGRPVIITSNPTMDGHTNYSAQCACGGWCTTGRRTARGAAEEWQKMCDKSSRGWIRSAATRRCCN